jgi:O-methyltransferase involved in polyketide biosynthesis
MSEINFIKTELAAALARGVRQCVLIASRPLLTEAITTQPDPDFQVFVVTEDSVSDPSATFVPTSFASERLATALEKSDFDRLKSSLFIWLGGAGYRAVDGVMSTLAFIASLPKGSGVLFDYVADRTSLGSLPETALDALASRISLPVGGVKHLIQPQAVEALLHGLGFRQIVDFAKQDLHFASGHLISASL